MAFSIFFIFLCSVFVHFCDSVSIDYSTESKEVPEQMDLKKLQKPEDQVEYLIKLLNQARAELKTLEDDHRKTKIERDKAVADHHNYIVPITIHKYAPIIESEFGDVMKDTTLVPRTDKTPPSRKHLVTRKFRWNKILDVGEQENNKYVKLLVDELDRNFKREKKVEVIDKKSKKYREYRLNFCDSVVKAIAYGDRIIAHVEIHGTLFKFDDPAISDGDNVVNEYTIMFCDAMARHVESSTAKN